MKILNTYLSGVFSEKIRWYGVKACQLILNPCPPVYIIINLKIWSDSAILNPDKCCLFAECLSYWPSRWFKTWIKIKVMIKEKHFLTVCRHLSFRYFIGIVLGM